MVSRNCIPSPPCCTSRAPLDVKLSVERSQRGAEGRCHGIRAECPTGPLLVLSHTASGRAVTATILWTAGTRSVAGWFQAPGRRLNTLEWLECLGC
eukprot:1079427-Prymnesium_polylepis.1